MFKFKSVLSINLLGENSEFEDKLVDDICANYLNLNKSTP